MLIFFHLTLFLLCVRFFSLDERVHIEFERRLPIATSLSLSLLLSLRLSLFLFEATKRNRWYVRLSVCLRIIIYNNIIYIIYVFIWSYTIHELEWLNLTAILRCCCCWWSGYGSVHGGRIQCQHVHIHKIVSRHSHLYYIYMIIIDDHFYLIYIGMIIIIFHEQRQWRRRRRRQWQPQNDSIDLCHFKWPICNHAASFGPLILYINDKNENNNNHYHDDNDEQNARESVTWEKENKRKILTKHFTVDRRIIITLNVEYNRHFSRQPPLYTKHHMNDICYMYGVQEPQQKLNQSSIRVRTPRTWLWHQFLDDPF